jgi:3-oxoacyl-[acyl-carrier protein] reductase
MVAADLRNVTALVTGASSGIGAAIAKLLAEKGYTVIVTARRAERLASLVERAGQRGNRSVIAVAADITKSSDRARLFSLALAVSGRIDILVNAVGRGQRGPIEFTSLPHIRDTFESNVFGPLAGC